MGFSKEIIAAALDEKAAQKKAAERRADAAKYKLYERVPELTSLDMRISATGSQIAIAAITGGDLGAMQEQLTALTNERKALIAQAGGDEADFAPKYNCAKCHDSGAVQGKLCSCVYELCKKLTSERMSSEMPLAESTFANFDLSYYPEQGEKVSPRKRMQGIYNFCREYAEKFDRHAGNLLFLGRTGLGKTHLSLAIANRVIEQGYSVIYGPSVKLIGQVEKEHFSRESSGSAALDQLLECDLLIIDDLGTEFVNSFSVSVINNIVNSRILENRPTIISTNLSLGELEEKYSPRVASRLIGHYAIKQFLGEDIRQKKIMR